MLGPRQWLGSCRTPGAGEAGSLRSCRQYPELAAGPQGHRAFCCWGPDSANSPRAQSPLEAPGKSPGPSAPSFWACETQHRETSWAHLDGWATDGGMVHGHGGKALSLQRPSRAETGNWSSVPRVCPWDVCVRFPARGWSLCPPLACLRLDGFLEHLALALRSQPACPLLSLREVLGAGSPRIWARGTMSKHCPSAQGCAKRGHACFSAFIAEG